MTTGNYVYDNFVRIDCGLSPQELWTSIVHETAHFTLAKQSSYGLFCFFLQQDMKAGNEECEPVLRLLDQAVERTSECYARTMELLLDASFTALSPGERARVVEERRAQPYWSRYRMDLLEPLLLNPDSAKAPVFPHLLFILAAHVDTRPLFHGDVSDSAAIRALMLQNPLGLCPDRRLPVLIQAFTRLLDTAAPAQITCERIMEESGLTFLDSGSRQKTFLRKLWEEGKLSPGVRALLERNLAVWEWEDICFLDPKVVSLAFGMSITDAAIPYTLQPRFSQQVLDLPAFKPARNVVSVMLNAADSVLLHSQLHAAPSQRAWSAVLQFWDTRNGIRYQPALVEDVRKLGPVLELYQGALYFYLDDYRSILESAALNGIPSFFRVDLPWNQMEDELCRRGFRVRSMLLQKYSESVFFCFRFNEAGNAAFSMHFHWELQKAIQDFYAGNIVPAASYGSFGWKRFRDLIAAVTEDRNYAGLSYSDFCALRLL